MENIINLSKYKHIIFPIMHQVIHKDKYQIVIDDEGQHAVCLDGLQQANLELKQDDEREESNEEDEGQEEMDDDY